MPSYQHPSIDFRGFIALLLLSAAAAGCRGGAEDAKAATRAPAQVDAARLRNADAEPGNWMSYGRTYDEQRYSPLQRINVDNVKDLGLAWVLDFNMNRGPEATPIVVDGVLYVSTAYSLVKAVDAKTGRLLWSYDPQVPRDWVAKACCGPINRGVAVWQGRVYVGTLDGRLVSLDAASGQPVWSVLTIDPTKPYSITGAPRVVKGRVIIGNGGAELGVRGYVSAYDAADGRLVWRFYTVPGDPAQPFEQPILKEAAKTWNGEWWKLGGGGTVWDSMAYDPELDLLYIGVGNGSPWNQAVRSPGGGDNLFLSSIVALRPDTGEYVWHYQTTPGEEWDFTATQHIMLADLMIGGVKRKVLMQAPKNGLFYVLDRATGEFLSAKPFVPITWASGVDPRTGRPIENPDARYSRTGKVWAGAPGPLGAHSWQPMAFSPKTGLVYIPANESGFVYVSDQPFVPKPMGYNVGVDFAAVTLPQDPKIKQAIKDSIKGWLIAWDPVGQQEVWRAPRLGPGNSGVLATAGNLVFQGTAAGDFHAHRADTGERLWSMPAQTGVMGGPVSYEVDGEQYIAVTAGSDGVWSLGSGELSLKTGHERTISRLLVFKLGGTASLPPLPAEPQRVLQPPPETADAATLQSGLVLYSRYCGVCHGDAAVSGRVVPDLRYSAFLLQRDAWTSVVLDGALKDRGMAAFAAVLDHDQAEAVRAYVIRRAHESLAAQAGGR